MTWTLAAARRRSQGKLREETPALYHNRALDDRRELIALVDKLWQLAQHASGCNFCASDCTCGLLALSRSMTVKP